MSTDYRFQGLMGEGYMRQRRQQKRIEAELRNESTPPERRRQHRRDLGSAR